jgi:DmsE family decaheme c-type cytochrome
MPANREFHFTPRQRARLQAGSLLIVGALGALLLCTLGWAKQTPAQPPASPAAKAPSYVGSEACQVCHDDVFKAFQKNPHLRVEKDKKRGWEGRVCESCHGPGSKHAESATAADIQNPAKLAPASVDRTCLKCHLNKPTHVGRIQSGHARNQVGCTSCHSIHKAGPEGLVTHKADAVNKQCRACHPGVWAQFQRPHKHPLPEGAMSCVDCHNPHGSFLPKSMQTSTGNQPGCFKCHGDKRGPFVYNHAPVQTEGCSTCHEPHGSANPMMLTRHEVSVQCLECHANIAQPSGTTLGGVFGGIPPAIHDLRSARYRNCTTCHIKIHGSNVDRAFRR